jgi:hypothetical protein
VARIIQINAVLTKELLLTPGAESAAFRMLQTGASKAPGARAGKRS